MSLILDALNKAQRERQEQHEPVPQLSTVHYTPPPAEGAGRRKVMFAALGGAAAIALASFAAGLWLTRDAPQPPQAASVAEATPAANTAPAPRPAVERPPVDRAAPNRMPAPDVAKQAAVPASNSATTPAANPSEPANSQRSEVAGLYEASRQHLEKQAAVSNGKQEAPATGSPSATSAEPASQAPAPAEPKREIATTLPAAKPASEPAPVEVDPNADTLAARVGVPYVQQLSWGTQQHLPSLNYSRHQYDPVPASRGVEINGRLYRMGATIADGLTVDEILRDGVILRYQSKRFKLDALNSWMNF